MIVFRRDYDKTVCTVHSITPHWKQILDVATIVIIGKSEIARVKQNCFQILAFLHNLQQPVSDMLALPFFAIGSKKNWDLKLFHLILSLRCS